MQMKETRPRTSARNKMMDYIARRDHSEKELRQKLRKNYTAEEIEIAITYGKEQSWIPNSEISIQALAEKTAEALHRKKKGILFINSYLKEKGLPEVEAHDELELEKAQELVKNKYLPSEPLDWQKKQKLMAKMSRFLMSRGFATPTIKTVISKGWK